MDLMSNSYFTFALIVLGFGFLIFVHELGHFLVAKMVGIKTTQFAIGFGHSLLTWRKGIGFRVGTTEPEYEKRIQEAYQAKHEEQIQLNEKTGSPTTEQADRIAAELGLGETEYRLNYIPLGGYVKMLGQEDIDPSARSDHPRAFNNKSVSARFAVISAGVIMNLIFGMIFFIIAFMSGVKFPPAIVGAIAPDSPAATTYAQGHEGDEAYLGLQLDDRITHVDGKEVGDMFDVKYATILASEGVPLTMTVQRAGESGDLTYMIVPEVNENIGLLWIGIDAPLSLEAGKILEGSKAEAAGLTKGMVISAVNGEPVESFAKYDAAVTAELGREVVVTFTDPKTSKTVEVRIAATPQLTRQDDSPLNLLGLVPPVEIAGVIDKKPAKKAGVEPGDIVTTVGGLVWPDMTSFPQAIRVADGKPVSLTVLRDGREVTIGPITPKKNRIGVVITPATDSAFVSHALAGSPADASTIVRGSRLISANGQPVGSWADLQRILGEQEPKEYPAEVVLEYELNLADRPREQTTIQLTAEDTVQLAKAGWTAPLPDGMTPMKLQVAVVGDDPLEAAALGFTKTHQFITQTYMLLVRLTQRTVPVNVVAGPIGIVHQGTKIAERGWEYLLYFLGLISINLAVINFLPIPITDGGQAVFLAAEKIKGSPVSVRIQTAATLVGLAMLACVFLYVTYNDVQRLFSP